MFLPSILNISEGKKELYQEFSSAAFPHMNHLYNFALRMTGNEKKSKALLKETYKRAFWFYEWLEKDTDIYHWLFRVMRNAYLNLYSKPVKQPTPEEYEEVEKLYLSIKTSSDNISELKKEEYDNMPADKLSKALSSLPEDFRIVIILTDIIGFSYEETADFVDIPVGVVRSRIYRGRKMLFTKINSIAI